MQLSRPHLSVLLNALYDAGDTEFTVTHPSEEIGDLLSVSLDRPARVEMELTREEYTAARGEINTSYGSPAVTEVPEYRSVTCAAVAGGLITPSNQDALDAFLDRYGTPDLTAGHKPVVAGFDTNLLAWRIADVLDLHPGKEGTVNGFALATGVRDELDWDEKRTNTRPIEDVFGEEFEQLWNQPKGTGREGRLGANYYRHLRDHRYADEVPSDRGDEAIITGYEQFEEENQKQVLLFSNDRDFIERAKTHRVLAQRVEFPTEIPGSVDASWGAVQDTLYLLAVLFGVLHLPKVTLYGVWKGKSGQAWENEEIEVECRSPAVRGMLERDVQILASGTGF